MYGLFDWRKNCLIFTVIKMHRVIFPEIQSSQERIDPTFNKIAADTKCDRTDATV